MEGERHLELEQPLCVSRMQGRRADQKLVCVRNPGPGVARLARPQGHTWRVGSSTALVIPTRVHGSPRLQKEQVKERTQPYSHPQMLFYKQGQAWYVGTLKRAAALQVLFSEQSERWGGGVADRHSRRAARYRTSVFVLVPKKEQIK